MPTVCPTCQGRGEVADTPSSWTTPYKITVREGIPKMDARGLRHWGLFTNGDDEPVYSLEFEACSESASSYFAVVVRCDAESGEWLLRFSHYWAAQLTRFPILEWGQSFATRKEARTAGIAAIEVATVDHGIVRLLRM